MSHPSLTPQDRILLPRSTTFAVIALGMTQIVAWGSSFYALGVLGQPIVSDTGWDKATVFGGFTTAVLASSAVSTWAGRAIDRWGARGVMSAGFLALAASIYALSEVRTIWAYYTVWPVIGIAMRLTLYDAAFAAMVQVDPANGRRAIAYLTLFGGFASTVGWTVGHALNEAVGWRDTLVIFAAANLIISLPLAWFGLPAERKEASDDAASPSEAATHVSKPLEGRARTIAMVLFSIVMSANAFIFGVGAIHLVGIIEASGLALATAVGLAAMKGVAQVGGRLWELLFGRNLAPMMLGRIAIGLLPIAFCVLLMTTGNYFGALAFTLIFGASNGLVTIVRGAVPLALFGPAGYGTILGILATPVLLFNAVSPLAFAALVDVAGYGAGAWVLLAISVLASVAMEVLCVWYRRRDQGSDESQDARAPAP
ncbi:MAG: MFS transporter [Pseudomonadota bacterium]